MITTKDITVSVPCMFPDERPIWMLRTTADQFGYSLRPYGLGQTYAGWVDIKINKLRAEAETCPTSHILYTDARDAFFLAGPEEVAEKYNAMGAPPLLLSAQCDVFGSYAESYEGIDWDMSKVFRYVGTPGMLCEARALQDALEYMQNSVIAGTWPKDMPDDDPPWWNRYMKEWPGMVKLDTDCSIFMNAGSHIEGGMWERVLSIESVDSLSGLPIHRVANHITKTLPCVLHFNGGSSDALTGKWQDIKPYWQALGHREMPPWEDAR
jgi:hypothetical protein